MAPQDSIGVTLKPAAVAEDASNALPQLVHRIATERDGLKNITNAKLEDEVARDAAGIDSDQDDATNVNEVTKDLATQQKELWAAKNELVQLLDQARNPIAMALDTTSFQIREQAPQLAEQTLSPYIKQNFKQGSLGLDRLQPGARSKVDLEADEATSTGWSLQNLHRSADLLLNSAQKLKKEVEKETRYWQGVSEVKRQEWSISRIPRQRNTVGVKFGFAEAGPLFQAQGHAALRANDDGQLVLDRGLLREHKAVHVRLVENGNVTGQSQVEADSNGTSEIEDRIRNARDSLFEEELFHEMICEARALFPYNVKIVQDAIHVPMPPANDSVDRHILISLDESQRSRNRLENTDSHSQASSIALACRILLTNVYRQRFRRRSRPPPPLSAEKSETQEESHILASILNFVYHRAAVERLLNFTTTVSQALTTAGLKVESYIQEENGSGINRSSMPMETLVQSFGGPHKATQTLSINLNTASSVPLRSTVSIQTAFAEPIFGTSFSVDTDQNERAAEDSEHKHPAEFSDLADLLIYLRQQICLYLVKRFAQRHLSWKHSNAMYPVLRRQVKDLAHAEQQNEDNINLLAISLQQERLTLVGKHDVNSSPKILAIWPGPAEYLPLHEVVAST